MNSQARIGIDVTSAVTQGGGIGRYTRELVRALVELDSEYSYRLFSAKQPPVLPVPNAIPVGGNLTYRQAPVNERWLYRLWYRLRLPLPVQWFVGPVDLFHSPDFVLPAVSGAIPTLLTVHDLSFVHYPDSFTTSLVNYLNHVVPWSVKRAHHVLADSQATMNDLVNFWNVPPEKVTVLHSGVADSFRPVTSQKQIDMVRSLYGIGSAPYILSVGTLQPRKNLRLLVRAFKPVAERHEHNLIIAGGKGWLFEQMLEEVRIQGLEGRVRFVGFVDDSHLPALYSDATLFVFPSKYEGFGLPLLEAMACGVPVVTSHASSLPEVAGAAALQLSPSEQDSWTVGIGDLLADSARRIQMVALGFLQARQFTWSRSAEQLLGVYRSLLGQ